MYDPNAIMGRFSPPTNADLARISEGVANTGRFLVLIEAADASRSSRLPWTAPEREAMIRAALGDHARKVVFRYIDDRPYDQLAAAAEIAKALPLESSSYLWFAGDSDPALLKAVFDGDDATLEAGVPVQVFQAIQAFRATDTFTALHTEYRYIADYKKSWAVAPYAPIFVTVDMVIVHAGRVLLIQRGGQPGRGLWALPGGFLDGDETLQSAAQRELREETGLRLELYDDSIIWKSSHVFDDPQRSARGRTITHAYHVEITDAGVPIVIAADDAAAAQWMAIEDLASLRSQFFEDHGHILNYFLKT